ncbi:hypothetical protein CC80DRAFT_550562 [Byssothecium circinans]|uniref:Uncharacterized protein n=1 Tax=Byssothecium circinans TaxID=147558 RepID=A0A6A5TN52_9PLEO|nr:hypothetical protein CC80DRAFT_550562 [Byssothecium circinans]
MEATKYFLALIAWKTKVERTVAYLTDNIRSTHNMEDTYKSNLFCTPVPDQPNSQLHKLPAEVRMLIYKHVFTSRHSKRRRSSIALALLATCRLIHGEAYEKAFESVHFRLNGEAGLSFYKKIWSLGSLQQHLRRITIKMAMEKLEYTTGNNPFVLMQLPLDKLEVDFGSISAGNWDEKVHLYHRLVPAVLFRTPNFRDRTRPIYKLDAASRALHYTNVATWQFSPEPKDLYDVMVRSQTKEVMVKALSNRKDVLWSAFRHFGLVTNVYTQLDVRCKSTGEAKEVFLIFADENRARSYFKIGRRDVG